MIDYVCKYVSLRTTTSCELISMYLCTYIPTQRRAPRKVMVDEPRLKQAGRADSLHPWRPVSELGLENCSDSEVRAQICCSTPFSARQRSRMKSHRREAITHFLRYLLIRILHTFVLWITMGHSINLLSLCLCRSHSFMLLRPSSARSSVALQRQQWTAAQSHTSDQNNGRTPQLHQQLPHLLVSHLGPHPPEIPKSRVLAADRYWVEEQTLEWKVAEVFTTGRESRLSNMNDCRRVFLPSVEKSER